MTLNFAEQAWLHAAHYNNAMDVYQTFLAKKNTKATGDAKPAAAAAAETVSPKTSNLVNKIQETRNNIKEALKNPKETSDGNLVTRIDSVEAENKALKAELAALNKRFNDLESRLNNLGSAPAAPVAKPAEPEEEEDDDDVDLFGSDDDDQEEADRIKAERIAAYNERKAAKEAKKGALIAKSNIILDVKPWDDETDMAVVEAEVRKIETDGLLWGAAKLVAIGYGIKKLQICCVVEDDKVGTDFLEENICALEDYVQSVDVAAFNKI